MNLTVTVRCFHIDPDGAAHFGWSPPADFPANFRFGELTLVLGYDFNEGEPFKVGDELSVSVGLTHVDHSIQRVPAIYGGPA